MVIFEKIRWKNFLSTGSVFTEIDFLRSPSTLIVGENGAGKSTLIDALCFVLFNKPYRKINKPQLVNSINQKDALVEVEFRIGKVRYKVARGIKPSIFTIERNGILLDMNASGVDHQAVLEEQILKFNIKSFVQTVALGTATFTPFMQLPEGHRREIIEDILDISIFSTMNVLLKEEIQNVKDRLVQCESRIEVAKQKVDLQKRFIESRSADKQQQKQALEEKIIENQSAIKAIDASIQDLLNRIEPLKIFEQKEHGLKAKIDELKKIRAKLEAKIERVKKELTFYHDNSVCPTCSQDIAADTKHQHIDSLEKTLKTLEEGRMQLVQSLDQLHENVIEANEQVRLKATLLTECMMLSNKKSTIEKFIAGLQAELHNLKENTEDLDQETAKLSQYAAEALERIKEKAELQEERKYQDACALLLKDNGIKTKIIRQYLPLINKMVNKYLQTMDFWVSFELDETFNETLRSRHRDAFSYASFSEGEKQKIDLSILFTWRAIAKMKNSTSTNLLILDEVMDSSLHETGIDALMEIFADMSKDTNLFVISHREHMAYKFRSVIRFEKHNGYSVMV